MWPFSALRISVAPAGPQRLQYSPSPVNSHSVSYTFHFYNYLRRLDLCVIVKVQKMALLVYYIQERDYGYQPDKGQKTYGIKNHFKSLNEAIFKTNLRLITRKGLSLFPASFLQEHVFLVSGYPSLILCFWHCYQKYNSKPPCGKSTPAPCKERRTSMATEAAPERASTDKSPTFPLRCERDLKRKALYHWERLAVICLQHFSP